MKPTRPIPEIVHLICRRCGRKGRYSRERYIEVAGEKSAPDALQKFAAHAGCELAQHPDPNWDRRCGIVYDLEAREEWLRQTQKKPPPAMRPEAGDETKPR